MKRRAFFKLLGAIGLAPAVPAAIAAAAPVAAAPAAAATPAAAVVFPTSAIAALSISMERMGNVMKRCVDYFEELEEAIDACVAMHIDIAMVGLRPEAVRPGDVLDADWFKRHRGNGQYVNEVLDNIPEGMSFIVDTVECWSESSSLIKTRIEATEIVS